MGTREPSGLRVIVVGAGLAGLACGVSLRRQGHAVEVSAFFRDLRESIF
jgi:2-polyprenyl-6-methoxyphenol hydroxylase-like FAD-dependent oxidoreductase